MNIELLPGLTNVIRFPLEERTRPSCELLREIEPDIREVMSVAEAFGLDGYDPNLTDVTDCETARYLAEQILPVAGPDLNRVLDEMMAPVVERAVAACRVAHASSLRTVEAQQRLHAATVGGSSWLEPLKERAEATTQETAELLVAASARCQEVRGMKRAIGFARKGEPWAPYDPQAEDLGWLDEVVRRKEQAAG
jgi:hypothetical protein